MPDQGEGLSLADVLGFVQGRLLSREGDRSFSRVTTDSRKAGPGDLFVALRGEHFDGHEFVDHALNSGVSGVLVEKPVSQEALRLHAPAVVQVADTLVALGDLAAGWRSRFQVPVGVLTGSNGKTTTKEMAVSILRLCFSCLWTPGNYNNRIGLPLTLLTLGPEHERVILEMGMNEPDEIRALTRISCPQAGMLINIGPAHLEGFGSMEAVAAAKAEMVDEMSRESIFVFNRDDPRICSLAREWGGPKLSFGLESDCDVSLLEATEGTLQQRIRLSVKGEEVSALLQVPGRHNVHNALAAAALACALGASREAVEEGLTRFQGVSGRFSLRKGETFTLVDDSYNANPRSMQAALENLSKLSGDSEFILVLGDMLELGDFSREAHLEVGRQAGRVKPSLLCITGDFAEYVEQGAAEQGYPAERIVLFKEPKEVTVEILKRIRGEEWILVKGSRGMALERVVEALEMARS